MRSSDDGNNADADPVSSSPVDVLHRFSSAEIKMATNNFSNFLAKQVLDQLYSGKISANCYNGDVMVKLLYSNHDFRKERDLLSVCDHVNIISPVGYCEEEYLRKFLVYDFKPNGTLHDYLYKHDQKRLNVEQRLEICIGVAKALSYLHSHNLFHIIKSRLNLRDIFLDDNLVPKMTRFDTSRIIGACKRRGKRIVHAVLQRHGDLIQELLEDNQDIAPEHVKPGYTITCKTNVYTFGVLMLEVLCCEKSDELERTIKLALPSLIKGEIPKFASEIVKANISKECLLAWGFLISDCMDNDPDKRSYII